jgi:hypothetical protein
MKILATAAAVAVIAMAPNAFAEDDSINYPYDPRSVAREQAREVYRNNYNYQYDNRYSDERYRDDRYARDDRYRNDRWSRNGYECWNPRARHFEGVREGERQDDLDFSRCRPAR